MSELKRVAPQTLELSSTLSNATKKEKGEKGKRLAPSFRFELLLDDKNQGGYSEFTYSHLLKAAEKKRNKEVKGAEENPANGLDLYDEDDDDEKLREIARRFETKYGGNTVGKNRKKYDDDVDLGAGYDENDSFIDNTDAYDEVVPAHVTTAYGGFYINSGLLEFSVKTADRNPLVHRNNNNNNDNDSSESSDEEVENSNSSVPKRKGTRSLSSSDEDDTEENASEPPPPKKAKIDENGEKKSNHDGVTKKRKKINSDQEVDYSRSKNAIDDKREIMEIDGLPGDNQEERKKSKNDLPKKDKKFEKKSTTNGLDDKKILDPKKLTGKQACTKVVPHANIDDAIESVVNDGKIDDESSRDTVDSNKSRSGAVGTSSDGEDNDKADLPLLDQLPDEIKDIISKLKKHAVNNKEGKIKFFDANVNSTLLHLEKKLRTLDSSSARSQVYSHLAHFLNVSKVTLINRAKKLCVQDAEDRVNEPIQRLKTIIEGAMPMAVEKYNAEYARVAEDKGLTVSVSEADSSEADEKMSDKSKLPRKRYCWSSEARKLVYEIANLWRQYYTIRKPRKESVETFVSAFLESKVLPLWPDGWMRLSILLKYSNPDPSATRIQKKQRDTTVPNNVPSTAVSNCSVSSELTTANSSLTTGAQERAKTPPSLIENFSANIMAFGKPSDLTIERKQSTKYKEKHKEISGTSSQLDNSTTSQQPMAKISVVPTAQLMAQKPKSHSDKFNPMDLTSSSLSITPVNDYPKSSKSHTEVKKDVVSITPYSEPPTAVSVISELSHSVKSEAMSYSMSNQNSITKAVSLKQRILQDNTEVKTEKRFDERDGDAYKSDHKEKKRDRWSDEKHKSHDSKKRRKEHNKSLEHNQGLMHSKADVSSVSSISSVIQPSLLSKEEQEQRQIEETMAATNFLSQIINDDSARSTIDKRKESGLLGEDGIVGIVQPSEQEKDVQMVMRSLKELQELQLPKSSNQYGYNDDYHRLYHKKDEKLRLSKDDQW